MKTLIVEIDNILTRYEKNKNEILGDNFQYINTGFFYDFRELPAADKKIVVLPAEYVTYCFEQIPSVDLSIFDLVVVLSAELLPDVDVQKYVEITRQKFFNNNVIIVSGAVHKDVAELPDNILIFPLFLLDAVYDYSYVESTGPKPKLFDALLGGIKEHRRLVFNFLEKSKLLDKSYVSMIKLANGEFSPIYYSNDLHELECSEAQLVKDQCKGTFFSYTAALSHPRFNEIKYPISRQIPSKIYQNSYYSIVTETNFSNSYTFYTEKTVKPLLAKRMFVMFGTHHQLKKLRDMGFKTFNNIIDESYDDEIDDTRRWEKACDQVLNLSYLDPDKVLQEISEIVNHNYSLISNRERLATPLRNWLMLHINKI